MTAPLTDDDDRTSISDPSVLPFTIGDVLRRPGALFDPDTAGPNLRATYALVSEWFADGDLVGAGGVADALQLCTIAAALDHEFASGDGAKVDKLSRNWQDLRAALTPVAVTETTTDILHALGTPALRVAG